MKPYDMRTCYKCRIKLGAITVCECAPGSITLISYNFVHNFNKTVDINYLLNNLKSFLFDLLYKQARCVY